ncbi:MAG: hypothetical protein ACTHK7_16600 [Aureliella sp.]
MAVRLPVILSQPARRDASTTDLVETLVAAALLVPGLDANLIGDIHTLEPGSTDHVCLLGHTRDVVLASFLELSEARAAWQRLGQGGHFVDLSQEEAEVRASLRTAASARKVFYYQLTIGQPVERLLERCRQLLAAQQVSLVSIQLGGSGANGSAAADGRPMMPLATQVTHADRATASQPGAAARPVSGMQAASQAQPAPRAEPASGSDWGQAVSAGLDDSAEWSALDKLVDDLDAMDL